MATKTAILAVKIVSDAKDFTSKMDTSMSKLDKFQARAKKLSVPAAAVLTGLGSIALGAGKMASEAEQNFGAVDAVFKNHAKSVHDMAKNSADTLGLSASKYEQYSALIGAQLKNAGVPMDQLAGQTDNLIGMAADFSAQFGGTVPEAVEALSSALKGEMDPIEKYGISLSESKIKAQMAADGTDKLTGAAYNAAKAQAIQKLITDQGKDAMGAFGREADTAAGKQARMTAKWEDASAKLGTALLPYMETFADVLGKVAKWVSENEGLVQGLAVGIGILAAAILILNGVMAVMNILALVNPWVLLAVGVAALVAGIVWLATQTQFFQTIWSAVASFATAVWAQFTGFVRSAFNAVVNWINGAVNRIRAFFGGMVNNIRAGWNAGMNFIRNVANSVINGVVAIINRIRVTVSVIIGAVRSYFAAGFNYARSIVQGVINGIVSIIQRISSTVSNIISSVRNTFAAGFNFMRSVAQGAINGVIGAINGISNAVSGAIGWVRSLFNMGGMPGWLSKVLGMGGTGFEFSGAFAAPVEGQMGMGATGGLSAGTSFSGSRTAPVVNNYNITVNGAVDAQSVARQLKTILTNDAQRTGRIEVGASLW